MRQEVLMPGSCTLACFGQVFEAAFMSTTPSGKAQASAGKDEEPKDLEKMST
jgi:hypothetical protein